MRYGRFLGLLLIVIGTIFGTIAYVMLERTGSTIQLLFAGPVLAAMGASMLVFPGENVSFADSQAEGFNPKTFMRTAPLLHRLVWGAAATVGFVLTLPWLF